MKTADTKIKSKRNIKLAARIRKKRKPDAPTVKKMKWEGMMTGGSTSVRQLFFKLLYNYPDGSISIVSNENKFIFTGGELHSRLKADPHELIGGEIYPKFPATLRKFIIDKLESVFQGKHFSDFELPILLNGDSYAMDAFPIKEDDGSIIYAGVIIRNITELKKADEELRNIVKKGKELNELKTRFVTMASHEFRTPLTTILSSAALLRKHITAEHTNMTKHVERIMSSVNALTDILTDFLSVSKIQEDKIVVNPVKLSVSAFMGNTIGEIESMRKKGQNIIYNHIGHESVVLDPYLFKNIVISLLSNAIKFSPENSPIEVSTGWKNNRFLLSITDKGMGIPDEYREHLFEQFYRASNALNIQGTGLGLYIVNQYVQLLNGNIEFISELQKGSRFTVSF